MGSPDENLGAARAGAPLWPANHHTVAVQSDRSAEPVCWAWADLLHNALQERPRATVLDENVDSLLVRYAHCSIHSPYGNHSTVAVAWAGSHGRHELREQHEGAARVLRALVIKADSLRSHAKRTREKA